MNIIRTERLIFVKPTALPNASHRIRVPESVVLYDDRDVNATVIKTWNQGFFPILVFQRESELTQHTRNISLSHSRWSAFAIDAEETKWLSNHPSLEVLRGLAGRDFLALPDAEFEKELISWIAQDPEADMLLTQLRDGRLEPTELEAIAPASDAIESENKHFGACWLLDPQVTLEIIVNSKANQLLITAYADDNKLLPKSLGELGNAKPFTDGKLKLDMFNDFLLILRLSKALGLPLLIWIINNVQQTLEQIWDWMPAPALAYRGLGAFKSAAEDDQRHCPANIPKWTEHLHWKIRHIESIPEDGLIILSFQYTRKDTAKQKPTVTVYINEHLAKLHKEQFLPSANSFVVEYIGDLEGDFNLRLEMLDQQHLVVYINSSSIVQLIW